MSLVRSGVRWMFFLYRDRLLQEFYIDMYATNKIKKKDGTLASERYTLYRYRHYHKYKYKKKERK